MLSTFPWLCSDPPKDASHDWSTDFAQVTARSDLSLDPKRWSQRFHETCAAIRSVEHFTLGDVVDVIEAEGLPDDPTNRFNYVAISDTSDGIITPQSLRGWELPERAQHRAKRGDIFVGGVWSSVSKWFVAGGECSDTVVTNGFKRLCLKPGQEEYIVDIVAGLVSENYLIQARALCTGSDGLAELGKEDIVGIILPRVVDRDAREAVKQTVTTLLAGRATVSNIVTGLQADGKVHPEPADTRGRQHVVQV